MAEIGYIVSALLMGVVLVALATTLARTREWRSAPTGADGASGGRTGGVTATVAEMARTPLAWTIGFLALVVVFGVAAVGFVAGSSVPAGIAQAAGVTVGVVFVSILGGYLLWGVYHSARYRGLPDAHATMVGMWVFGLLLIAAVVVKLLMA